MRKRIQKLFLVALLCTVTVDAVSLTQKSLTKLYVATFDRAPDAEGFDYWLASGLSLEEVAKSFFEQAEIQEQYPSLLDADFVREVYKNIFKREVDASGLAYWVKALGSGTISRANLILAVVNGALDDDEKILANKTEVALLFVDALLSDVSDAKRILVEVTADRASVEAAKRLVHLIVDPTFEDTPPDAQTPIDPIATPTITHNGTTYGLVTSPNTGKVWLDRNLGAARVCTNMTDTACYGDYYQFGRDADGHEDSLSATTPIASATVVNVGHGDFIIAGGNWTGNFVDANGLLKVANWAKTDGTSVCPTGFRLPTTAELFDETVDAGLANQADAFDTFLKIPSAGGRANTGVMVLVDTDSFLWTGEAAGNDRANYFLFSLGNNAVQSGTTSAGIPVRCIEN